MEIACGRTERETPGAGAAGGTGFALLSIGDRFRTLELVPGIDLVMAETDLAGKLARADIVWNQDGDKSVTYDGRAVTFSGPWPAGPIQKVIVAVLALRMEAVGLHPSHSAAGHHRGKTIRFRGGESNPGKRRGTRGSNTC